MPEQPDRLNEVIAQPGAFDAMLSREGQPGGALHRMHMAEPDVRPIPEEHEKTRPMTIPELADLMNVSDRRDRFAVKYLWSGWLACEFYDRTIGGPIPPDRPGRQIRLFRFDADQLLGRYPDNGNDGRPYIDPKDAGKLFPPRR